jgi:hypothetical protein
MDGERSCPNCGEPLPAEVLVCPACREPVGMASPNPPTAPPSTPPDSESHVALESSVLPEETPNASPTEAPAEPMAAVPAPRPGRRRSSLRPSPNPFAAELARRLARLQQWQDGAQSLDVEIPALPKWAEEAARTASNPEQWAEAVRGVERLAQKRVLSALEDWEKQIKVRLGRLEAYSVDSRLERDQIEDVLHAARTGDVSQGLATYQQVDRVVALKERHLDQAREELERVVALLKDMNALGFVPPQDPAEIAGELERELRAGRLAALKQEIRALRLQSVNRLKVGLPAYITDYGNFLIRERAQGTAIELEAMELARGARDFFKGRPEEALRRLRTLAQNHNLSAFRPERSSEPAVREPSRRT